MVHRGSLASPISKQNHVHVHVSQSGVSLIIIVHVCSLHPSFCFTFNSWESEGDGQTSSRKCHVDDALFTNVTAVHLSIGTFLNTSAILLIYEIMMPVSHCFVFWLLFCKNKKRTSSVLWKALLIKWYELRVNMEHTGCKRWGEDALFSISFHFTSLSPLLKKTERFGMRDMAGGLKWGKIQAACTSSILSARIFFPPPIVLVVPLFCAACACLSNTCLRRRNGRVPRMVLPIGWLLILHRSIIRNHWRLLHSWFCLFKTILYDSFSRFLSSYLLFFLFLSVCACAYYLCLFCSVAVHCHVFFQNVHRGYPPTDLPTSLSCLTVRFTGWLRLLKCRVQFSKLRASFKLLKGE